MKRCTTRLAIAAAATLALAAAASPVPPAASTAATPFIYDAVTPGRALEFPSDLGSHPGFRTEWWYVTGWLTTQSGEPLGFQITFFRTNPGIAGDNPSSFAPHQLLIAHCAISDPKRGRLWQDQKIRRAGQGLAEAARGDTDIWIDRWSLKRTAGVYHLLIDADEFSLHLELSDTQPPLLHGAAGMSRKGPAPQAASYYYSLPHLAVTGSIARKDRRDAASGEAWFDHEWSSEYLDGESVGWDWIGINLDDGAALMAFRIRGAHDESRWAGGTLRGADGSVRILDPAELAFTSTRSWQSPRTGISYPVQWRVRLGSKQIDIEPLLDDQESDTRISTGAIYWEGAVRAYQAHRLVGRGYLELTGYGERLRLP